MRTRQRLERKQIRQLRTWYPARRNPDFILDRPVTDEAHAASYNNFYEFSVFKGSVYKWAAQLSTSLWQVEVADWSKSRGSSLLMNCCELRLWNKDATASAVWKLGRWLCRGPHSHARFLKSVEPLSSARYIRLVSFWAPAEAPNQSPSYGPWPYSEELTMAEANAEANNELTMLAWRDLWTFRCRGSRVRHCGWWCLGTMVSRASSRSSKLSSLPSSRAPFGTVIGRASMAFEANVDLRHLTRAGHSSLRN